MSFRTSNHWRQQQLIRDRSTSPGIVVINERDPSKTAERIVKWLVQHYPGLQMTQVAMIKQNNRIYSRADFQTTNGQRKVVLFDITTSMKNNLNTAARIFQAGTMVRLWSGTTSTPTRTQVLI